jgi:hypothetical protein
MREWAPNNQMTVGTMKGKNGVREKERERERERGKDATEQCSSMMGCIIKCGHTVFYYLI